MRPRSLATLAAALIAVPLVAGCGDAGEGASSASGDAEGLSPQARYVRRATEICRAERKAIAAELAGRQGGRTAEALREVVLPGFRRQYEGLRKLWPPRGDEDFLDLMLSKFSRSLENGEEELAGFFRVKLSGYSEFAEGTLMTEEYGIRGCGSQGRSPEAVYRAF
jgi:hypothetical protein